MISQLLSRLIVLGLGTLYPAYRSYKAVKTKDVREYVKWMMYWIVFAIFTLIETFTDFFLAFWFPFYYEIKIVTVIWLLSPATKGSSILYRRFVHPWLVRREEKIDGLITTAKQQSYDTAVDLGHKVVQHTSRLVLNSMVRAPAMLEHIVQGGRNQFDWSGSGERPGRADIVDVTDLNEDDMPEMRLRTGTLPRIRKPHGGGVTTTRRTYPDVGVSRYRSVRVDRRAQSDERDVDGLVRGRGGVSTLPRSKKAAGGTNRMTQSMTSFSSGEEVQEITNLDNEEEDELVVGLRGGGEVVKGGGEMIVKNKSIRGKKKVTPVRKSSRRLTK